MHLQWMSAMQRPFVSWILQIFKCFSMCGVKWTLWSNSNSSIENEFKGCPIFLRRINYAVYIKCSSLLPILHSMLQSNGFSDINSVLYVISKKFVLTNNIFNIELLTKF